MNRTKVMQPEKGGKESDVVCVAMFCTNETQSKNMVKHVDFKTRQCWVQTPL